MTQLYLISPPSIDLPRFTTQVEEALSAARKGFVGAFQLRLKEVDDDAILAASRALQPLCARHDVAFILNDRPDLLAACKADGVHLGQEDLTTWPIAKTRKTIGENASLGISCHASMHLAMEAAEQGADYVAFGAFYPTTSKPMEKLAKWGTPTLELLRNWVELTTIPAVAIGGITPQNAAPLVAAGADFCAAISAVWNADTGITKAIQAFEVVCARPF